jgi:hypothetical protein
MRVVYYFLTYNHAPGDRRRDFATASYKKMDVSTRLFVRRGRSDHPQAHTAIDWIRSRLANAEMTT